MPKGAKNEKAALAFARWFLSQPAQVAYGKADGIPVRSDVLASDLAKDPMNRWMPAYLEALKTAKQELGYQERAQVEAVLGLKLNQALIGELSSARALTPGGAGDQGDLREERKEDGGGGGVGGEVHSRDLSRWQWASDAFGQHRTLVPGKSGHWSRTTNDRTGPAVRPASRHDRLRDRYMKLAKARARDTSAPYCDSGCASPKHWTFHVSAAKAFLRRTAPKPLFTGRRSFAMSAKRLSCEMSIRGFLPAPEVM